MWTFFFFFLSQTSALPLRMPEAQFVPTKTCSSVCLKTERLLGCPLLKRKSLPKTGRKKKRQQAPLSGLNFTEERHTTCTLLSRHDYKLGTLTIFLAFPRKKKKPLQAPPQHINDYISNIYILYIDSYIIH